MAQNPKEERIGATMRHQSGDGLAPFQAVVESVSAGGGELVDQVSALIERAQSVAAAQVNTTLTLRNWYIGRLIDVDVLKAGQATTRRLWRRCRHN